MSSGFRSAVGGYAIQSDTTSTYFFTVVHKYNLVSQHLGVCFVLNVTLARFGVKITFILWEENKVDFFSEKSCQFSKWLPEQK